MEILDESLSDAPRFHYQLKTTAVLTMIMVGLGIALLLFRLIGVYFLSAYHPYLSGDYSHLAELASWGQKIDVTAFAYVAVFALGMIPYGMWLYRAYYNLEIVKARGLVTTPGWAVGYHFIPFANLYFIPAALNNTIRGSKHFLIGSDPKKSIESTSVIPWGGFWIGFRIFAGVTSYMGLASMLNSVNMYNLSNAVFWEYISITANMLTGIILFYIVLSITKQQDTVYLKSRQ